MGEENPGWAPAAPVCQRRGKNNFPHGEMKLLYHNGETYAFACPKCGASKTVEAHPVAPEPDPVTGGLPPLGVSVGENLGMKGGLRGGA